MPTHPLPARATPGNPLALLPARVLCLALPLVCGLASPELGAQNRLVRTFAHEQGLAAPPVWALAQDSTGFLWIGAEGGLFRFDGTEIRRWARETVRGPVVGVAVSPTGEVVVCTGVGELFELAHDGAVRIPLPTPAARAGLRSIAYARDGTLWALLDDRVVYRGPDGVWRPLGTDALHGERPRRLHAAGGGGVHLVTDAAIWDVSPGAAFRRLYSAPLIVDVVATDPRRLLVLVNVNALHKPRVVEVTPQGTRELVSPHAMPGGRAIALVERAGTLWLTLDRYLVAARPGERPEVLGEEQGVESGGPLLVDHEGSLWLGSFGGLHQYPEPDTRLWSERDGLSSRHVRFVARSGNALWAATWQSLDRLHRSASGWSVTRQWGTQSNLCTDASGAVWTAAEGAVLELRDTLVTRWAGPPVHRVDGCTAARNGGVWLGAVDQVLYAARGQPGVRAVPPPAPGLPHTGWTASLHDRADRVWVTSRDRICHAPAGLLLADAADAWECDVIPGLGLVGAVVELPSGTLWAASDQMGMLVYGDSGWRRLPMDDLPTRTLFTLAPSPRGGVWQVGIGILQRVRERQGGWEVLERLTGWHGLSAPGGGDLVEDADGTVWIASSRGVTRVPPGVRFATPPPPRPTLVQARANEESVALREPLQLPHDRGHVELRFAALSFRDPPRLRHQVRLAPDEPWRESNGRPSFQWVDLPPRRYEVEYRASLDGRQWSPEPIRFTFRVLPAWYQTPWFVSLAVLLLGGLGWAVYRARLAHLLGLERQRTRIAMDLHDEVGSGLASVGILSGVLAAGLDERERRETASDIAAAAEDLSHALSDIVWSLDPQTATLEELAVRLAEHGYRLCAGGEPAFSARFPEAWPPDPVEVAVRRNVLLVGLEALHNAGRHAQATTVTLSLLPSGGGEWTLTVRDDGVGFAGAAAGNGRAGDGRRGRGLQGMQHRADEIRALLHIDTAAGRGTSVILRFGLRRRSRLWAALSGRGLRRRLAARRLA